MPSLVLKARHHQEVTMPLVLKCLAWTGTGWDTLRSYVFWIGIGSEDKLTHRNFREILNNYVYIQTILHNQQGFVPCYFIICQLTHSSYSVTLLPCEVVHLLRERDVWKGLGCVAYFHILTCSAIHSTYLRMYSTYAWRLQVSMVTLQLSVMVAMIIPYDVNLESRHMRNKISVDN